MKVSVNLNDKCKVILTAEGARILNNRPTYGIERTKIYKAGDEYNTQVWVLMDYFGKYLGMTRPIPFDLNNIEIEVSE